MCRHPLRGETAGAERSRGRGSAPSRQSPGSTTAGRRSRRRAGSVRVRVLETKLRRPALPGHVVARRRLDETLDTSTARLVIVHAKAGAGKTTALARFAQRSDARVAWCSVDRGDNDPQRFLAHVVAAIDHGLGIDAIDLI